MAAPKLATWDVVDGRWEVNGVALDKTARDYLFPPRLNAYYVEAIPTL